MMKTSRVTSQHVGAIDHTHESAAIVRDEVDLERAKEIGWRAISRPVSMPAPRSRQGWATTFKKGWYVEPAVFTNVDNALSSTLIRGQREASR
jgi:hypothetical protein